MNASELKAVLLSIVQQIDDLRVNEAVLLAKTNGSPTLGDLLEVRKSAESIAHGELSALRKQIEALA